MVAGCGSTGTADTAAPAASAEAVDECSCRAGAFGDTTAQKPEGLSDEVITVALQAETEQSLVPDVVFLGNCISAVVRLMYEPLVIQGYKTMTFQFWSGNGNRSCGRCHIPLTLREGVKFRAEKNLQ